MKQQPSGIRVGQMRVPLGVFGMIFESRPNVTIEAASLSIKSGNACILRGGSEAIESNKALARLVQQALAEAGLPVEAVQLVQTTDREAVGQLIAMPEYVDVIIPRGGKGLIERISRDAKVPVIKHLDGNCHVYVDDPRPRHGGAHRRQRQDAEVQPLQRQPKACWCAGGGGDFLPRSAPSSRPRAWRCAATRPPPRPSCARGRAVPAAKVLDATEQDWSEEYLAPIISIKVVDGRGRGHRPHQPLLERTTPTRSSRATTCMRSASCARSTRPA
jgi:glutamate-5-semialdehyde dehydrogenase